MDFVILLSFKDGLTEQERDEALVRRAQWSFPEGITVLAEYWTTADEMAVVVVARADEFQPLWSVVATWQDKFDITVLPAVSAEEGLRIGPEVLTQRLR